MGEKEKMIYRFTHPEYNTNWREGAFIDVETVESKEELDRAKATGDLSNLDILNKAKFVCVGVFKEYDIRLDKIVDELKRIEKGDKVFYINPKPLQPVEIALIILIAAYLSGKLYAFNGMRFDFLLLKHFETKVREWVDRGYATFRVKKAIADKLGIEPKTKSVKLIDLIQLAKSFGVSNLDEFAKLFLEEGKKFETDSLEEYLIRDVEILMDIAVELEKHGFEYTPTRTARKKLKEWLNGKFIKTITPDTFIPDYIGGRTQVFKFKAEGGYSYDFNSLYPSVIARTKHPKLVDKSSYYLINIYKVDIHTAEEIIKPFKELFKYGYEVGDLANLIPLFNSIMHYYPFLKVRIKGIKEEYKPVAERIFPFSFKRNDGKRCFYLDESEFYWVYGYETAFLEMLDYEIVEAYLSQADFLPYRDKVEEYYQLRKEAKKRGDKKQLYYKIVLNSSYGIFGLRKKSKGSDEIELDSEEKVKQALEIFGLTENNLIYEEKTDHFLWIKQYRNPQFFVEVRRVYQKFYFYYEEKAGDFSYNSVPPLALSITSNARFILNLFLYHLKRLGYEIYYTDTDSIYTNAPLEVLTNHIGDDLMQLKHEKTFSLAYFLAPKTYLIDGELKAKGTGKEPVKTIVRQSFKTDFKVITRRFLNYEKSKPAFLPDKDYYAIPNKEMKTYAECENFINLLREIDENYPSLQVFEIIS
jgi:hypothetical protein